MFKTTRKRLGRLIGSVSGLVLGAASAPQRDGRRPFQGLTTCMALDDTAPLRLALGEWLERKGYPYTKELRAEGGNVTLAAGRWVVDGGGCTVQDVRPRTPDVPTYQAERGEIALGRTLWQTSFLRVFPLVGVGGITSSLQDATQEEAPVALSRWTDAFVSVGLGVDLRLRFWHVGLLIGLRLSYQRAFATQASAQDAFRPPLGVHVRLVGGIHLG